MISRNMPIVRLSWSIRAKIIEYSIITLILYRSYGCESRLREGVVTHVVYIAEYTK